MSSDSSNSIPSGYCTCCKQLLQICLVLHFGVQSKLSAIYDEVKEMNDKTLLKELSWTSSNFFFMKPQTSHISFVYYDRLTRLDKYIEKNLANHIDFLIIHTTKKNINLLFEIINKHFTLEEIKMCNNAWYSYNYESKCIDLIRDFHHKLDFRTKYTRNNLKSSIEYTRTNIDFFQNRLILIRNCVALHYRHNLEMCEDVNLYCDNILNWLSELLKTFDFDIKKVNEYRDKAVPLYDKIQQCFIKYH